MFANNNNNNNNNNNLQFNIVLSNNGGYIVLESFIQLFGMAKTIFFRFFGNLKIN